MAGRRTFRVLTSSSSPASKVQKQTATHTQYNKYILMVYITFTYPKAKKKVVSGRLILFSDTIFLNKEQT